MNSLQIEYFLALAKYKNFTDTAKALYVSQPAISKQIASLEQKVGFSLFFRSNRNVSLTPAGLIFLKAFTNITEQYNEAITEAQNLYTKDSKKLRLGCIEGMELSDILNKVFTAFSTQVPNIEFQIERHQPLDLMKSLFNGDLDAAITLEAFMDNKPNLRSRILLKTKHYFFVSLNNPILSKESFDISDLENETFICLSPNTMPAIEKDMLYLCEQNGFKPKRIQYVPNVESQMLSVELGLGFTIGDSLLRLYNNHMIRNIELKTTNNIHLVWKKNNTNLLIPSFTKLATELNK